MFNATTVALPKAFEEPLASLMSGIAEVGLVASLVFALASFAQIAIGRGLEHCDAQPLLLLIARPRVPCLALAAGFGEGHAGLAFPAMLLVFGEIPTTVGRHVAGRCRSLRCGGVDAFARRECCVVRMIAVLHARTGRFEVFFLALSGCRSRGVRGPRSAAPRACELLV